MTAVETEAISGELVKRDAPVEPAASTALDRAAEAALAMPGVPGRDEFLSLAAQAKLLSLSGAAPKLVRNNPHIAFHVAMVGRDLGISPTAALALIDVIDTASGPQISLSPQLLNAQIERLGLGSVRPIVQERDRCVAGAYRPDGTLLGETEFTWGDAQDAGLAGLECLPGAHTQGQRKRRDGSTYTACPCNQGYRTYPKRMMWWRAAGFCANDWFPSASVGLYSPEELGAVVDSDGRPIDPATVALPQGYDDPIAIQAARQAEADVPAPAEELFELQLTIRALPEGLLQELAGVWKGHEKLKPYAAWVLPKRLTATARAMATAKWAQAAALGVERDTAIQAFRERLGAIVGSLTWCGPVGAAKDAGNSTASAAPAAQESPEEPPAPEVPAEPAEEHTAPPAEPEDEATDWRPVMRQTATMVQDLIQALPDGIGHRISTAVEAMHHTVVNRIVTEGNEAETFPPTSPIGLRRMAATYLLGVTFQTTGEIPPEVEAAEPK
ncbi:MAG TPA: hypothetical protein VK507_14925 [Iamia sp.]|nr:hypothetical protein [Iamia sp.]